MTLLLQDPIHYPHGTKFMAPGPMGQCYPLPDNPEVQAVMLRTAENHRKIFDRWNFDYHTKVSRPRYIAALCREPHLLLFADGSIVTTGFSFATLVLYTFWEGIPATLKCTCKGMSKLCTT